MKARHLLVVCFVIGTLAQSTDAQGVRNVDGDRVTVDHGDNPNGIGGIDSVRKSGGSVSPKVTSRRTTTPPPGGAATRSAKP